MTPTVAVSINNTDVNVAHGTGTVTFAFSEAPAAFALADTSAVGGTLSNLQQIDATHYTATFTGAANTDISNAVGERDRRHLAGGQRQCRAGGSTAAFTVDTVTPTVAVSINSTDVNVANDTATVTFAFSEAPTAFALADTSAVGGTLSNLQQIDATTYTATFTGAANTDISNASVSVTAGSWQDPAGNAGAGGSTAAFTVDTRDADGGGVDRQHRRQPGAQHGDGDVHVQRGPTSFTLADTSAVGGTLSNLTDGGSHLHRDLHGRCQNRASAMPR